MFYDARQTVFVALITYIFSVFTTCGVLFASVVEYDLNVTEARWSPEPGMKPSRALMLNGGIPGPTLRFREGDTARIRVKNLLKREETSIHWHGLLVPNSQDGVPYVTTPPIQAGETRVFEFPLRQAGTYWYHSHTDLQEQSGVYGSIVIEPKDGERVKTARDHVVVLSDWTRENPHEVMRSLMRGSDWYAFRKGAMQSVLGAAKAGSLADFWDRERSRMPAMDVSDVAYDAFLANGKRSIDLKGKPGERVRLRFINAGAATYFYLQSATGPVTLVGSDGKDVKPFQIKRLLIGMAETYDVVLTVPRSGRWEIRATSQDGTGHASMWIGSGDLHTAADVPKPELYNMDAHLMAAMDEEEATGDEERPLSPYRRMRAVESTAFAASLPRRTIELRLSGDMTRYVWSFNGKTMAEDGVIKIQRGEALRLELINDSMMHHPLHLHGHFFRVIEGQGNNAPLKHTVDVPPMGKRTIEFEANEQGDWLFHCHLLYHMHSGMARVFSYEEQGAAHRPNLGEHARDPFFFMVDGSLQNHMSMGMLKLMNAHNDFYGSWDLGIHHHDDGEDEHEFDYEADVAWRRVVNSDLATLLGWRFTNREDEEDRAFGGIEYRLPYLVHSSVQIDSEGDVRVGIEKSLQLTDRISWFAGVQYDSGSLWEWTTRAEYLLSKRFSLITQYHSEHGFGAGLGFRF